MRRAWIFLFLANSVFAAAPVITPSIPIVYVSSAMQFSADQTVTWSLQSGSTGTISAGGLYTAPGPLVAKHSLYGWPIDEQDSVFTTDISGMPIDVASTTYLHAQLSAATLQIQPDMPTQMHTNSTPTSSMVFANSGTPGAYRRLDFPDMRVENGFFSDSRQVDQHVLAVNKDTGEQTEIYKFFPIGFIGSGSTCDTCNSGSGVKYTNNYSPSQGVGAGGLPIQRLTDSYQEIKNCADNGVSIKHALRFTLSNGPTGNTFKWPAVAEAASGGQLPYGTLLRLKSSFALTGSNTSRCIEAQLKTYGMYLDDLGTTFGIQFLQDSEGDYTTFAALTGELPFITGLNSDNFEAVNISTLQDTDANSPTLHGWRVNPTNGTVTPDSFAVVIASNTTTHLSSTMPIYVQPVTVGVEQYMGYSFLAGTPQTTLNVWTDGAVDTTFSCAMSPTLGSLTSGGLYTPPTAVTARSSTTVTCTATADAAAKAVFPVYVYPLDGIRVRLANASNADYGPDANGKTWFIEQGAYWRLQGHANCDWSADTWPGVPDSGLYKQCEYVNSGSGDLLFRFKVPNGNYQTKLYFAIGDVFSAGSWITAIDSQGQIYSGSSATTMTGGGPWTFFSLTGKQVDVCDITGSCASKTPGTVTLNQTVSDGNLYFAVRHLAPSGAAQPASLLNAFSVILTSSGTPKEVLRPGLTIRGGVTFK